MDGLSSSGWNYSRATGPEAPSWGQICLRENHQVLHIKRTPGKQYASSRSLILGRPCPQSLSTFFLGRANGRGVPGPTPPCPVHDPACSPPSTPDPSGQKALLTHTLSKSQQVGRSSSACGQAFARFPGRQRRHVFVWEGMWKHQSIKHLQGVTCGGLEEDRGSAPQ